LVDIPEIISRGFVFERLEKDLLQRAARGLKKRVEKERKVDKNVVKVMTENYLGKFFYQQTGRRPMILPVVLRV